MSTTRTILPVFALGLALLAAACGSSQPVTAVPSAAGAASTGASPAAATSAAASSLAPSAATGGSAALVCAAPATPTIAETEGPYYKAGAPESANLVTDGMAGTRLTLTGYVVDTSCTPIADTTVEIWQANAAGQYDNSGYTLRGWVRTDAQGRFTIQTVVPGEYPGRTEHIHVKVTPPGGATLTTQVYFPGTTQNDADGIYDPSLLLTMTKVGDALVGAYTFVVAR